MERTSMRPGELAPIFLLILFMVVLTYGSTTSPSLAQNGINERRYIVAASRDTYEEAKDILNIFKPNFPTAGLLISPNGKYAIILGRINDDRNPDAFLNDLKNKNLIPQDSFLTSGVGYGSPETASSSIAQSNIYTNQMKYCDQLTSDPLDTYRVGPGVRQIDTVRATAACEAAIREAPGHPRMLYQLARVYAQAGRNNDAAVLLKKAAALNYPAASGLLAMMSSQFNQSSAETLKWIAKGISEDKNNCSATVSAARFFGQDTMDLRHQILARIILDRVVEICPSSPPYGGQWRSMINMSEVTIATLGVINYTTERYNICCPVSEAFCSLIEVPLC